MSSGKIAAFPKRIYPMPVHRFIISHISDPRAGMYLANARALGFNNLRRITCQNLYFIEGQLSQEICEQLALKLLTDPVTQSASWTELPAPPTPPEPDSVILEVSLRPGVTDPVAAEIVRAAHELGINGVHRVATGQRFILHFDPSVSQSDSIRLSASISATLLANNVIQHWKIGSIEPSFPEEVQSSGQVETIAIRNLSNDELLTLSKDRRAALDLAEMQAIRSYCQKENRDLTDVEFETIAQTWSEHCVHKTFKASITVDSKTANHQPTTINSIIKT